MTRTAIALLFTGLGICGAVVALSLVAPAAQADDYVAAGATPTAEEYVAQVNPNATIVESGNLILGGHKVSCGVRPVVLDPKLDDFAAAYDGFILLNPTKLEGLPPPVALWIYSHECGHQFHGPDEDGADCFAAQRGRRQGWLRPDGIEQICNFISPAHGDMMHFAGPQRCETVRRCYGEKDKF